jgi:hypothetical protein
MLHHRMRAAAGNSGEWTPTNLGSTLKAWWDVSDLSTLFQNSDGTTAVAADGDPVGYIADKSGNGFHLTQATSGSRPTYKTSSGLHWLDFDGTSDFIKSANGDLNLPTLSILMAFRPEGGGNQVVFGLPQDTVHTGPFFRVVIFLSTSLTARLNGAEATGGTRPSAGDDYVWGFYSQDGDVFINNSLELDFTGATVTYPNSVPFIIGSNADGGEYFDGRFYGGVVCDTNLGSSDRTNAKTFLGAQAGISL